MFSLKFWNRPEPLARRVRRELDRMLAENERQWKECQEKRFAEIQAMPDGPDKLSAICRLDNSLNGD